MRKASRRALDSGPSSAETAECISSESESRLLARLRSGDDDAYAEFLGIHGGPLLAVARRLMRSEEDARDCLQDAFLSAFRGIDRFEGNSKLGTWLHRIVVNACLMRLRSQKRKPEELMDPQEPEFDSYGFRVGPTEMAPVSADELLERQEVREQIRKGIDCLPENYRTVLVLRDIEEFDTAETAEMLGLTPGAVKVRLHRARLALRSQIGSLFE